MQVCKRQLVGETVCTAGGVIIIVIMILITCMVMTFIMISMIMRVYMLSIRNCRQDSVITLTSIVCACF